MPRSSLLLEEATGRWTTLSNVRVFFIAGYGVAQAVSGRLFTFSAYLGTVMDGPVSGCV